MIRSNGFAKHKLEKSLNIDISNMTILFDGYNERRQFGASFTVYKNMMLTTKYIKVINPRLEYLKIETEWFNITLINANALIEDKK